MIENFDYKIPINIQNYISQHNGCTLSIDWNRADLITFKIAEFHEDVYIKQLTRTCRVCGYDLIWQPDKYKCNCPLYRHKYDEWRYDDVFIWHDNADKSLEESFNEWLKMQPPQDEWEPIVFAEFGT